MYFTNLVILKNGTLYTLFLFTGDRLCVPYQKAVRVAKTFCMNRSNLLEGDFGEHDELLKLGLLKFKDINSDEWTVHVMFPEIKD